MFAPALPEPDRTADGRTCFALRLGIRSPAQRRPPGPVGECADWLRPRRARSPVFPRIPFSPASHRRHVTIRMRKILYTNEPDCQRCRAIVIELEIGSFFARPVVPASVKGHVKKVIRILCGVIAAALLLSSLLRPQEPVYPGEPLSVWFGHLSTTNLPAAAIAPRRQETSH